MNIMLIVIIVITCLSLIAMGVVIYMKFVEMQYLKRIIRYGDGLVDIQARLKSMTFEHHDLIIEALNNMEKNLIKHVTYTNRWQKVMAKMIRVGHATPLEKATGSETIAEAKELHDIGVDIVKVAFDDKQALEEKTLEDGEDRGGS